mmetsp:Transcript_70075/g.203125  ORF Transcript_70075/g.203125 Transcript_70075/m.203125 type:complete len:273 (+) Transcript_70075:1869-2687(+)
MPVPEAGLQDLRPSAATRPRQDAEVRRGRRDAAGRGRGRGQLRQGDDGRRAARPGAHAEVRGNEAVLVALAHLLLRNGGGVLRLRAGHGLGAAANPRERRRGVRRLLRRGAWDHLAGLGLPHQGGASWVAGARHDARARRQLVEHRPPDDLRNVGQARGRGVARRHRLGHHPVHQERGRGGPRRRGGGPDHGQDVHRHRPVHAAQQEVAAGAAAAAPAAFPKHDAAPASAPAAPEDSIPAAASTSAAASAAAAAATPTATAAELAAASLLDR